jgi:WD40 repeat protein
MKHGLLTALPRLAPVLSRMGGIAAAALIIASSPAASAGIFGASKNDVAVKVASLPQRYHEVASIGMAFNPSASELAVESGDLNIDIWDWRSQHIIKTLEKPRGAAGVLLTDPLSYSPDGKLLAACDSNGVGDVVIRVWDAKSWGIAKDLTGPGSCSSMAFTPDGGLLVRAVYGGLRPSELIVVSVDTWSEAWTLQLELTPKSLSISPDGSSIAVGGIVTTEAKHDPAHREFEFHDDPWVRIISSKGPRVIKSIQADTMGPMVWSPDGSRLAIVGDRGVEIFDVNSGEKILYDNGEKAGHMNVRFSRDGRYFIESSMNGRGTGFGVHIWDAQRQKLLQGIPGNPNSLAVSQDSKYLAVGDLGHTTIWQFK